jgi:hypothetical protein
MKTKVFFEEFKGNKMFAIWPVDENGEKIGEYPVLSFGVKKAAAILSHIEELKEFVSSTEKKTT